MSQTTKISDIIIEALVRHGVDTAFGVTGGAAVHLFDSIDRNPNIDSVFTNHEQSASYAAEAYAKARKSLGVAIFTTGPGATNGLTGLTAAWLDSIPCLFISGQVRTNQAIRGRNLRQVGSQEVEIVPVVKPLTKYATTVFETADILYELEKAIYLAKSGRPGPVWLDIPVDIQWSFVDPGSLHRFDPAELNEGTAQSPTANASDISRAADWLASAARPVVLAGYGTRLGGTEPDLLTFIEKYQLPCVQTWAMSDFLTSDHPLNGGRLGLSGQRGANLLVQNCDLLLVLGSHLNATLVGTKPEQFAREARIIVVDVDADELENCSVGGEQGIQADVGDFLASVEAKLEAISYSGAPQDWHSKVAEYKAHNLIATAYADNKDLVNSYFFAHVLSSFAGDDDMYVIDGGGTIVYSSYQSLQVTAKQRLILSTGLCAMGSGLPEALGVCRAFPGRKVHLFVGDGSFPFNMQELALVSGMHLPLKIYVFNNDGYVSIRTTQKDFLDNNYVGSSPDSGLHLLDIEKTANSFGIPYQKISTQKGLDQQVSSVLETEGPIICEVMVSPQQDIVPRVSFAPVGDGLFEPRPIEDMHPVLERQELSDLMVVPQLDFSLPRPDGREIDMMRKYPKSRRPIDIRPLAKATGSALDEDYNPINESLFEQLAANKYEQFGEQYFDGSRREGYGGYTYDPKYWQGVAADLVAEYNLTKESKVLEIGCAKGFLLHDLQSLVPGITLCGLELSDYAMNNAFPSVKHLIQRGDGKDLPFGDNEFDLVLAINTLSELAPEDCNAALTEIQRVTKSHAFITLNAWRNKREHEALMRWNITAKSNFSVPDWRSILCETGYSGDYYWFFAG